MTQRRNIHFPFQSIPNVINHLSASLRYSRTLGLPVWLTEARTNLKTLIYRNEYHVTKRMTQNGSNHFPFLMIQEMIVPSVQTTDYWKMHYHPVWSIWVEEGLCFNEIEQDQTNHCEGCNRSKSISPQIKWHKRCQIVHNELSAATECRLTKNNELERRKESKYKRSSHHKWTICNDDITELGEIKYWPKSSSHTMQREGWGRRKTPLSHFNRFESR